MPTAELKEQVDTNAIELPYRFTPRDYQKPVMDARMLGYNRIACVWHRRAGKDKTFLNMMIREMVRRVGAYQYLFPQYTQARRVMWEGMDRDGQPFLDHFPVQLIKRKHDSDMMIELTNGSIFRLIGTDKFDSSMGTGAVGQVYSEYSLQNPLVWQYMQPILVENNGWALFNWTPRGKNHAYQLEQIAKADPGHWYFNSLTVDQTKAISQAQIEQAKRDGMTDDMVQQEFYLSYEAANPGAYFREEMAAALKTGRICRIPVETALPVYTFWDLGMDDSTTIWLIQILGKDVRAVGYYENSGLGLTHYANWLEKWQQEHLAHFGGHILPHDGEVRDLTIGKSRKQYLQEMKIGKIECAKPPATKEDGIELSRQMIARVWFERERCEDGIEALRNYRKEFNEERGVFKMQPVHDRASHGADGFQTLALWWENYVKAENPSDVDLSKLRGYQPSSALVGAGRSNDGGWMK